jgi:hypothetical protein
MKFKLVHPNFPGLLIKDIFEWSRGCQIKNKIKEIMLHVLLVTIKSIFVSYSYSLYSQKNIVTSLEIAWYNVI